MPVELTRESLLTDKPDHSIRIVLSCSLFGMLFDSSY